MSNLKNRKKQIPEFLWKLMKHKERSIVGILESDGLVKLQDPSLPKSFDNIILTDKGTNQVGSIPIITDAYISTFKSIFPKGGGNKSQLRDKLIKVLSETPGLTLDKILELAKKHVANTSDPKFSMQATYFIYKTDVNKITSSELLSLWEDEQDGIDVINVNKPKNHDSGRL
jgi:hypothetical protein